MKNNLLLLTLFLLIYNTALAQSNYILVINKDSIPIQLDKEMVYTSKKNKRELNIKLVQPNILVYEDQSLSFEYDKLNNISNTEIEKGISQLMVMRSTGSGFLIQKYETIDPSFMCDFMLSEITKESVSYGYEKKEESFETKIKSGQVFQGKKAILTYNGEDEIYTVSTFGKKDSGFIILTMLLNEDYAEEDTKMINLLWNSLKIKLKE